MVSVTILPPLLPDGEKDSKSHHIGNPPTGFKNPWPSFNDAKGGIWNLLKVRFGSRPPFIPVPEDRSELVPVREVDFVKLGNLEAGAASPAPVVPGFKITWIGHASFLLQTSPASGTGSQIPTGESAGIVREQIRNTTSINILCDPVFSERTSPFDWIGPKRYTPTPCTLSELTDNIDIDLVLLSHNHYDHSDADTLRHIASKQGQGKCHFVAGLHSSRWLTSLGIVREDITEVDWWDRLEFSVNSITGVSVRITCVPTQHFSARGPLDRNYDLWCSYAIEELVHTRSSESGQTTSTPRGQEANEQVPRTSQTNTGDDTTIRTKVYFSGDTGYRSVLNEEKTKEELDPLPRCPTFAQAGSALGPFDLALLPIGLCTPRASSRVHCNSWDSICIHKDVKAKRSIGMHWGTVRGGISQYYEDVRTPPRDWKTATLEDGFRFREGDNKEGWNWDIGLMDIGETLVLDGTH